MTDTAEPCWHTSTGPLEHAGPAGILGIVNLTPDSFFAKSRCEAAEDAVARALRLLEEGADIIDLGAESSRPRRTRRTEIALSEGLFQIPS